MTIDPKYAGLPGIATNQPDTYETVNSGEEEDSGTDTEETEPTVLHLSSLGWGGQDYQVGPEPGAKETLLQRFTRLRCEVGELVEECDTRAESEQEAGRLAGLGLQVSTLSRQLDRCEFEGVQHKTRQDSQDKITAQLTALRAGKEGRQEEGGPGVFQLFLPRDQQPSLDLAGIESRLAVLEQVVGQRSQKQLVLSAPTDCGSMAGAADLLASRRPLLQQNHLDHVEGRLAALAYKMNAISEQRAGVMGTDEEERAGRLAGEVATQAGLAPVLPDLLRRLERVRDLQKAAQHWSHTVDSAEQQQRETQQVIKDTERSVEQAVESFDKNLSVVAEKFKDLQDKLQTVKV